MRMKQHRNRVQRVGLLLFILVLQMLYIPINRSVQGGISTSLPVDTHIPLSPVWAIPYLFSIPWWLGAILWAFFKMEDRRWTQFATCLSLAFAISYAIYIVFPTYVERPDVTGGDALSRLVQLIYGNDRPYNALPSGHTYITLIITLFWFTWKPRGRAVGLAIAIVVLLSTLFTKQHAVLDLLAGVLLACLCWWLSGRMINTPSPAHAVV